MNVLTAAQYVKESPARYTLAFECHGITIMLGELVVLASNLCALE